MSRFRRASDASDGELIRRVQADDPRAFEQLYDRHVGLAFRVAHSVLHDTSRAEDAVQESFLAIWRGRAGYRAEVGSFKSWSMRIVRHRAIDSARRDAAGTRPPTAAWGDGLEVSTLRSSEDEALAHDEGRALRASLQRLPEAQAEVIALAFYGELSHSEIARQLALPEGTVKGRMRLGLQKLHEEMRRVG